ncbi:hypothetical protein AB3M83_03000 [Microbacterium sp. 179-B 1A2 NHS]|uniref:hypothetical protein n=1 Tax=Microbacterium sp. 179-B 1A2 NHS TaxID=3142383 RepID=UPI0039A3AA99
MDDLRTAELRTLRERAYGRDADIDTDPEARRRLAELEAAHAAESAARPAVPERPASRAASAPPALPVSPARRGATSGRPSEPVGTGADAVADAAAMTPAPTDRGTARSRAVTMALTWAGSLAAVAAVAVSVTAASSVGAAWPASPGSDPDIFRAATLRATPEVPAPDAFAFGGEGASFEHFHDLAVFEAVFEPGGGITRCLILADSAVVERDPDDHEGIFSGYVMQGCGAGAFPAVLSVVVDAQMPDGVREAYPDGSSLQFVLEGDSVEVFVAEPPSDGDGDTLS